MNWGFPEISTCLSQFKCCSIWKMQLWSKPGLVEIFRLSKFAATHIICWKWWFEIAVEGKFYHYQSSKHHQWDKTIQTCKNASSLFDNVPEMLIAWVIFLACFLITLLTSLFLQSFYSFTIECNTLSWTVKFPLLFGKIPKLLDHFLERRRSSRRSCNADSSPCTYRFNRSWILSLTLGK